MFRKFTPKESISNLNQVKTSVQRGIRNAILEQYPSIAGIIDELLPKKQPMILGKCDGHINLVIVNKHILFFNVRDGPYYPHLKLLHKYPNMMPRLQVDKGAIKFVMGGANIMCPGLTSPGAKIEQEVDKGVAVAIYAEGKTHAMAVGLTTMSTADIKKINKGIGVELISHIGDGLYANDKTD